MDKSHVGMGHYICPVCGQNHGEEVLLHRFMRPVLTQNEFLGYDMCEEHKKLCQDGYTALIEVENQPKSFTDAVRTGNIAHVKNAVWERIFNMSLPDKGMAFVEVGVFAMLQQKVEDAAIMHQAELYGH